MQSTETNQLKKTTAKSESVTILSSQQNLNTESALHKFLKSVPILPTACGKFARHLTFKLEQV